ncbi:ketosteroid isomerase [Rhizobium leguminosarum]|uniref:ketosteroid isomerase n=1 Tax=Rhizobium leguminosarum TaxID=384 RepID=UPI001FED3A2B|nr:ketosteroid isomerase [Rhizobium leguminosarum]
MRDDIYTIKELYAAAEGDGLDVGKFVSFFSEDAYVRDIPTDMEFRGKDIAMVAGGMAQAFPDIHRELFNIYAMEDVIVVEACHSRHPQRSIGDASGHSPSDRQDHRCSLLRCLSHAGWKGRLLSLLQRGVHSPAPVGSCR